MTSGKDDEEFFKQRGFGIKMGFGERPALIVIDMLKGFTDAKMPLGANLDKEIAAQKPLLDVAHERNIPVIFSTVIYNDHDLKDAGLWAIKMKGTLTLKAGTPAVEIDQRLDMRPTDSLLVKKYASCFFGTDLVPRLMNQRVDTLDHHRLHHIGLRARDRGRRSAERLPADGGARGGRRPLGGGARAEPVRPQRQICRRGRTRRDAAIHEDGRPQPLGLLSRGHRR